MIEIIEGIDENIFAQAEKLWDITGVSNQQRGDTLSSVLRTVEVGGRFYTAREGRRVVGVCWLTTDGRRLFVHHMAVHPDFQNRGIGRMLLDIAVAYSDKLGQKCKLEVHSDNAAARHLYESVGFSQLDGYIVFIRWD
ncbi:MAG: GNAT family N-acetyltransferase [Candidatus Cloacimonetes bacterium]|nr:GNAT family N-acetyltransferase [Candidatus Cloacimonadota bacterium]